MRATILACLLLLTASVPAAADGAEDTAAVSGVVRDAAGALVAGAELKLLDARHDIVRLATTDAQGRFQLPGVAVGRYVLVVASKGFAERRLTVDVRAGRVEPLEVQLEVQPMREYVTVTAHAGLIEDLDTVAQAVNIVTEEKLQQRAKAVIAQAAQEEAGVALQRTSPTMAGVFVRGLTGDKVNVFIDGFRYSNSAARGGVNTFLSLVDASTLQSLEILRGPNSGQFGSDAIGGSLQFFSRGPSFSSGAPKFNGEFSTGFNSADLGWGTSSVLTYSARKFGVLASVVGRRSSTLRTGGGMDSHNAVTRFLGLPSTVIIAGSRMPDTAFTQYGGVVRLQWEPAAGAQVVAHYSRSQQDGGKRYDQLLGGDGNLIADLRNLMNDFAYIRYDRAKLGAFDSFTIGYSFNTQREERVNQGGNGNPLGAITHQFERTRVHGLQGYVTKQAGKRHTLLVGGDFYHESIESPAYTFDPSSAATTLSRPRVPDNARYLSGGAYAQDVYEAVQRKLRLTGNVRVSTASYRARAADSPVVGGSPLWPDDSLTVASATFRGGVVVIPRPGFSLSAKISRGFRPPLMTDLGTLGLTGSGFEVSAADVAGLGGTIGSTAGTNAVSTGRPVQQLTPESSLTYEFGVHYRNARFDTDFAFFVNDVNDLIVKNALILPPGAGGISLGGEVITAQDPSGVVFVAASPSPVLVRANLDNARLRGFEHRLNWTVGRGVSVGTVWTYIRAHDRDTGLPPNIEGGIPAADGYLILRYAPGKQKFWIEPYLHAAGRQERLSSLDLSDRRTGAERTRSSIQNFFRRGATVRGLVDPGPDGVFGNADDVLIPTGETLAQVQDRVLGVGAQSGVLYAAVPGYVTVGLRGGFRIRENHRVLIDAENLNDRNYRGISWGLDAPGRSVAFRYSVSF